MADIEVVYCPVNQSPIRAHVAFFAGMRVADVLEKSGLFEQYPELIGMPVGIFSQVVPLDRVVKLGERIEIYRPLALDPMETRRKRAKKSSR